MVFGDNGSGKTSLLEAAHILGTAKSFRSGGPSSLISHGEQAFVVHGETRVTQGSVRSVGVQRAFKGELSLRVAGAKAESVARLADELPLLLINADSFDLLAGAPVNRRRFLDWGLFHVEHEAREGRRRFQRSLEQRNHLLRRDKLDLNELAVWTRDLAEQGEQVSVARGSFLAALNEAFEPLIQELVPEVGKVRLAYRQGWDSSLSYADALEKAALSDHEQGYTQSGPQRADIRVTVDGYPAAETLSRGQQKLLVCALKLAQGTIFSAREHAEVLYLIDDLPSELDRERCERVCRALARMAVQSLITCVDKTALPLDWLGGLSTVSMFHVEHGQVVSESGIGS